MRRWKKLALILNVLLHGGGEQVPTVLMSPSAGRAKRDYVMGRYMWLLCGSLLLPNFPARDDEGDYEALNATKAEWRFACGVMYM